MRIVFLILIMIGVLSQANAQRKGLLFSEKIDFDKQPKQIVEKQEAEITEEMDRFLGFGFHFSVKKVPLESQNSDRKNKIKEGISLQLGFQMPKYLRTKPPEKLLKAGWKMGLNL
jgi:hypothetical protein